MLTDFFVEQFKTKYSLDIRSNAKALFRLRSACEKVKKVLSANAKSPLNVECLLNDVDVSGLVERWVVALVFISLFLHEYVGGCMRDSLSAAISTELMSNSFSHA